MGIRDRLLRFAAWYANEQDAEDMVQTVLLRLLKRTPPNATIDLSNTYLHNCIRNAVGDQARR
jgi:DNA-directed RNA polymerase specialized sigma24 family protein